MITLDEHEYIDNGDPKSSLKSSTVRESPAGWKDDESDGLRSEVKKLRSEVSRLNTALKIALNEPEGDQS